MMTKQCLGCVARICEIISPEYTSTSFLRDFPSMSTLSPNPVSLIAVHLHSRSIDFSIVIEYQSPIRRRCYTTGYLYFCCYVLRWKHANFESLCLELREVHPSRLGQDPHRNCERHNLWANSIIECPPNRSIMRWHNLPRRPSAKNAHCRWPLHVQLLPDWWSASQRLQNWSSLRGLFWGALGYPQCHQHRVEAVCWRSTWSKATEPLR